MDESTPKEKVLKKIRNALINKKDNPYSGLDLESPIYVINEEDPLVLFANTFTDKGGKFLYCETADELMENLATIAQDNQLEPLFCSDPGIREILRTAEIASIADPSELPNLKASITRCEQLVARTGSIVMSSKLHGGRNSYSMPDVHIVIGYASQVVREIKHALQEIKTRYSSPPSLVTFVTGPSRTGDIEKTLVMGAHGPKELYLLFIDDRE